MRQIFSTLKERFAEATFAAYPSLVDSLSIQIKQSTHPRFGDYQFNSAMQIAKLVQQNPRDVADKIVSKLGRSPSIERVEIAGPGFINIFLSTQFLENHLNQVVLDPHLGMDRPAQKQRIIVEFSSPNIAKELHVGHLRSTIIGDCIARTFEYLGHDVLRLNHVGDWGTSFGMLIAHMRDVSPEALGEGEEVDLSQLVLWYKESKYRFDHDAEFKKRAQLAVVSLQGGDPSSIRGWLAICEISRKAYCDIYKLLQVELEERGESTYNAELPEMICDLEKKGLVKESDGAKCIFLEGFLNRDGEPLPLMMQKSDGGYGYDTTDVAAMRQRALKEKADRIIVVTDAGQAKHFAMVYQASVKAGYLDPTKTRFDHVPFGLVLGQDGKKFRSRSGDTEKLIDLLTHAVKRATEMVAVRQPGWPDEKVKKVGLALGIGAVKYADLSCHRAGDYLFSYDRMLQWEGDTAIFILYSYVRMRGIERKMEGQAGKMRFSHPSERALALHLSRFGEALYLLSEDLLPNRLTDYLYSLAGKFNAFYRDCKVEGSQEQASRLQLIALSKKTLKAGLHLLGVETVSQM